MFPGAHVRQCNILSTKIEPSIVGQLDPFQVSILQKHYLEKNILKEVLKTAI
jgi:hypothetical protein